ncbi:vWA domain-containing protein [Aeoliella mucimassa]|uniref:VWFA domain-containing protein n=1 Tax=Aeoliella mucimassa TaxID=2527972 RepID=A0A518ASJ1_9BACT|nr:VWA domain-containing protein [Aeoliella mucimassa]QDU57699.1 hypothetical protein Pan181_39210 [Aeoliella mucimassa]
MTSLFRNALEPLWLWGLMALLPLAVLALYFLKLKRDPVEVPSTYLWKKSIEDLHVNSLWQKLRRSLLLFLQLLLLALAILALLRPGWEGQELQGQRMIFAIDNSASMGSADVKDAESRLAEAKKQTIALIEQMQSDMAAMVISFNNEARVMQGFTSNRRKLREAVEKIELTSRPTNLLGALQLADGLANPGQVIEPESNVAIDISDGEKTTLYIFSDGRFSEVKGFSLGNLQPQFFVPLGTREANNLAITAFSTRRSESRPDERQAFIQVSNFSTDEQTSVVELSHNGTFLDAQEVTVPSGEARGVTFALAGVESGKLEAKLSSTALKAMSDALAIDNKAYAAVNDTSAGRVLLVTPGNKVLMTALSTERIKRYADVEIATPDTLKTKEHQELAASGAYDLIIYDQCAPEERMPRSNTLFFGSVPPTWYASTKAPAAEEESPPAETDAAAESTEPAPEAPAEQPTPTVERVALPAIIDQSREHPLMAYVELGDFRINGSNIVPPPKGGQVLVESTQGPLVSIAPREGFEDAVIGFELTVNKDGSEYINADWYRRYSFPTFLLNAFGYFVNQGQEGSDRTNLPGQALALRTKSLAEKLTVKGPDNRETVVERNADGSYLFHDTEQPGYYEILDAGKVESRFAVNLFDGQESNVKLAVMGDDDATDNIESVASLQIGHVEVKGTQQPARKEIWRPLLLLAIILLLVEWYIYNRRVYL